MPNSCAPEYLDRRRDAALIVASVPLGVENLRRVHELGLSEAVMVHLPDSKAEDRALTVVPMACSL